MRRLLGRGTFGDVLLAHDPQLDRLVALKVPRRDRFSSTRQWTDFLEEARTAAKLKHPFLVTVYDVQDFDGTVCIVQEYIDGKDLKRWAEEHRPTYGEITRIIAEVADALDYLHQERLIHCDLKLANVLMDSIGRPHVSDFGLTIHEATQDLRRGAMFGTPVAMAPEQVRGESHLFDGRTDIWAIGVMLYELLGGRVPFHSSDRKTLFELIQTHDPKPLRQLDRRIPRELDRICMKCLQKRRADRYATAGDLRDDLQAWLAECVESNQTVSQEGVRAASATEPSIHVSSDRVLQVVPKGLRSFDEGDADFFLELLPGPRDRSGLPDPVRFWKHRLEETDPSRTFQVGLIYGPSGCGKSSLMRAGVLPRLDPRTIPVYVEASADGTETRLQRQVRKFLPEHAHDIPLTEALQWIRVNGPIRGDKLVLVIDQFEQWLHSHGDLRHSELVRALRQCDGERLQAVVMVRDDFYLSVNRFFRELEVRLVEGQNQNVVDLFDLPHAKKVLMAFGRAYGVVDEDPTDEQQEFIDRAIDGLSEDDKIISVRLALFADMMSGRPWTPASLDRVGGVGGVGLTFLEEMFSAKTAPPNHRAHEKAIRGLLEALLPASRSDLKGACEPVSRLREAAGYVDRPADFQEVLDILDNELRIIHPWTRPNWARSPKRETNLRRPTIS